MRLLSTNHYHFYSMKHLPHVLAAHYLRLCAVNVLDNSGESDPNATHSKSVIFSQRSTAEVRLYFYSDYIPIIYSSICSSRGVQ
jgi:hypothetical protein